MAIIRFLFDGTSRTVNVSPAMGEPPTLLAIARTHDVPLLFNCEAGACGACIVEVETTTSGGGSAMSEAEAFFLGVIGGLGGDGPGATRLACPYRPGDDEGIQVRFASALCAF